MGTLRPTKLTLRAYPVGFGDCFLLSWSYPDQDRHVLIDFGTMALPKDAKGRMMEIAQHIHSTCRGKLHMVVATHRHADHISGFATKPDGTGTGDIIRALKPDLVLQPWTEDPATPPDAKAATKAQAFAALLHSMHSIAQRAVDESKGLSPRFAAVSKEMSFLGKDNLKNLSAVENLMNMGRPLYACYGSQVPEILPGVKVRVLGPPSLEQSDRIRVMRSKDRDEFWHLQAATLDPAAWTGTSLFDRELVGCEPPKEARWFCRHLTETRVTQLMEIVRTLDAQMNNTSLILLFEAGKKKFLFPGDAQYENWSYALEQPEVRDWLRNIDLYKVGHHGSLNATPKSMWKLFDKKKEVGKEDRLRTVMSTLKDQHGSPDRKTEVPRSKLVRELKKHSDLTSTQTLRDAEPATIEIDL